MNGQFRFHSALWLYHDARRFVLSQRNTEYGAESSIRPRHIRAVHCRIEAELEPRHPGASDAEALRQRSEIFGGKSVRKYREIPRGTARPRSVSQFPISRPDPAWPVRVDRKPRAPSAERSRTSGRSSAATARTGNLGQAAPGPLRPSAAVWIFSEVATRTGYGKCARRRRAAALFQFGKSPPEVNDARTGDRYRSGRRRAVHRTRVRVNSRRLRGTHRGRVLSRAHVSPDTTRSRSDSQNGRNRLYTPCRRSYVPTRVPTDRRPRETNGISFSALLPPTACPSNPCAVTREPNQLSSVLTRGRIISQDSILNVQTVFHHQCQLLETEVSFFLMLLLFFFFFFILGLSCGEH